MKLLQRTATDSHEKELISGTQKDAWQWRKPAVLNHQGTTRVPRQNMDRTGPATPSLGPATHGAGACPMEK